MMEMTARARNRMYDNLTDWQETRYRKNEMRQQQADIRRSRMTCSASLPSFHQTQDWTGKMGMSASGRFQVIEETKPKQRIISSDGIRWDAALTALIIAAVLLTAILLIDLAGIGTGSRTIVKLNNKISLLEERNEKLEAELILSTGSASVCTEAVKMDLISSNGARTIRLTAPENAKLTLSSAEAAQENREYEGRMTSYAGD